MILLAWLRRGFQRFWSSHNRRFVESCVTSLVVHLTLLLLLGLWLTGKGMVGGAVTWFFVASDEFEQDSPELFLKTALTTTPPLVEPDLSSDAPESAPLEVPTIEPPAVTRPAATADATTVSDPDRTNQTANRSLAAFVGGGGFESRRGPQRAKLLSQLGGNRESEEAVELALAWLAAHQRRDGSWRFSFDEQPCNGRCRDPGNGTVSSTTAATALALLPFLGAGHLPEEGPYGDVVKNGLYYLRGRILRTPRGGDLQEGTMYAQGLAALALCEAYAMAPREDLKPAAQSAIDFIANVQHVGGGWRYYPGQPGDTTVFGWQLMSLKSAQLGGLTVPSPVIDRASAFLDGVQSSQGAYYGYIKPGTEPGPTAIGLLCRMYYGWRQDDPRLTRGVAYLAKLGPSRNDMYFNYYAAQVLRHYGGSEWQRFNERLQDHLLGSQSRAGHERGSWHFAEQHGSVGGRLYTTAMCTMILEVYYRHMPIYGEESVRSGF